MKRKGCTCCQDGACAGNSPDESCRCAHRALVVNLFGGPGTGKSTTMAGVFHLLKMEGINAEMAPEFAKDIVWEKSLHVLNNQIFVFANQQHRIWRLEKQVDVIVTDSPLLLNLYYGNQESRTFHQLVIEQAQHFENLDIMLRRVKNFNPAGRLQNATQAQAIDHILWDICKTYCPEHAYITADELAPQHIVGLIMERL